MNAAPLLALLAGCAGNIAQLYEAERDAVLRPVPAAGATWSGDLRLRLHADVVQALSEAALEEGLLAWEKTLTAGRLAELTPSATVTKLTLTPGGCESCMHLSATVSGKASWSMGPLSGRVPFTGKVKGSVALALEPAGQGWTLMGQVASIDKLTLRSVSLGQLDATDLLRGWSEQALQQAPAFAITALGGEALPLRGARLSLAEDWLEIEALSDVNGGEALPAATAPLESDWELRTSSQTALALMRLAAFRAGTLSLDVAADPRRLEVSGEEFALDLRLWRLAGRGWWRDYTVTGTLRVADQQLQLTPTHAEEGDKSPGAGLADPLALLAEGRILEAVEGGLQQALPATKKASVGALTVRATTQQLVGSDGALVLSGTLRVRK